MIHEKLIELITDLSIEIDENGKMNEVDSITFISLVVRIEETFGISLPDEFLTLDLKKDLEKLELVISNLLGV